MTVRALVVPIMICCCWAADARSAPTPVQPEASLTMQQIEEFAQVIERIGKEVKSLEVAHED